MAVGVGISLWVLFAVFLFAAAFFALSEIAVIALDRVKLRYMEIGRAHV